MEKVEFITELTDDPEIECWPALLNQVFMNLLINGCQAIAQKQRENHTSIQGKLYLRMKLNPENDTIEIIFEDNGVGMDEETQKRILEPFYTTKEVGDGVGLGLSIAFGIIQKHGGKLTFTSSAGVGSCFTVSLPRQKT
jgi:signal transduction histidine kinase